MKRLLPSLFLCTLVAGSTAFAAAPQPSAVPDPAGRQLAEIERASGGRLGFALVDAAGAPVAGYREDERFAFCSTFKLLLAGMVLDGRRNGRWSLEERLPLTEADLVSHSPVMKQRVDQGWASIGDAARAIVTISDNAAANLLIRRTGGIDAFNQWLRAHGDMATRLDRMETELNENRPGDSRDTTTPSTIARMAAKLVFGDLLAPPDRQLLREWLTASTTGLKRIRAGLPESYAAGDKTGSCGGKNPSYNDVAFILPNPERPDQGYVLAVYLDRPAGDGDAANAAHAAAAELSVSLMNGRGSAAAAAR